MEKMVPHSLESEQGVLSSILIDPESLSKVSDFLRPDDFYRESHRLIYETMLTLDSRREPIDTISLTDELERQGMLNHAGGAHGLHELSYVEPTSGRIDYYARTVQQMKQFRDVIMLAGQMVADAYSRDPETVTKAAEALHHIEQGKRINRVAPLSDAISRFMTKLDLIHEQRRRGVIAGVASGFKVLDQVLGGFQPSDLIVLAARPAVGKTSLCLNIAHHVMGHSMREGKKTLMFSLEMGEEQLVRRLISMESRIDQTRLRTADLYDEEWEPIMQAARKLSEGKMWIDDTPGISISDMRSRARRMQSEHGLDLIIVDYMQLMKATTENGKSPENRVQEVSLISRNLKELARELNVPVLALAQLSRAVEQRADKVPQLSDLKESGSIEQDSDVVMFIHQETDMPPTEKGIILNIIVAKHRNGPVGIASLLFNPRLTQFSDIDEYGEEE